MNKNILEKYNNLSIISENREPQRAYYVPFGNKNDAMCCRWDASGRQVCSEAAGFHDMAIFKQGVTL